MPAPRLFDVDADCICRLAIYRHDDICLAGAAEIKHHWDIDLVESGKIRLGAGVKDRHIHTIDGHADIRERRAVADSGAIQAQVNGRVDAEFDGNGNTSAFVIALENGNRRLNIRGDDSPDRSCECDTFAAAVRRKDSGRNAGDHCRTGWHHASTVEDVERDGSCCQIGRRDKVYLRWRNVD